MKDDYIHFKLYGNFPGTEILTDIDEIVNACEKHKCTKVLVDCTEFNYTINTLESFEIGEYISDTYSQELLKISLLRKHEKTGRFTELVAQNRGANFRIFNDKNEAINWLKK